jgi:hypothetical protein
MYLKQMKTVPVRVSDPLRPGKRTFEDRMIATGATAIVHEGVQYDADEDGWIEVPEAVGAHMQQFRSPEGAKWYTPTQIDEEYRVGRVQGEPDDMPSANRRAKGKQRQYA